MTESVTVTLGCRSIFVDIKDTDKKITITFNNVSKEFIQGLLYAEQYLNESYLLGDIKSTVKFDDSYRIYTDEGDADDLNISLKNEQGKCTEYIRLCEDYDINLNKRYSAIISEGENYTGIAEFDSVDFISGLKTYLSWIAGDDAPTEIFGVFDNMRSCKVNVEPQLAIVDRKVEVKRLIGELLISDFFNTIWEYIASKCHNSSNDLNHCISDIDVIAETCEVTPVGRWSDDNKLKLNVTNEYNFCREVFQDSPNGENLHVTNERLRDINDKPYLMCKGCSGNRVGVKPFLCKVKFV